MSDGLKLFEISGIVKLATADPVGACNHRHLAALYTGKSAGFEKIHGLVDRIFQLLDIAPTAAVAAASVTISKATSGNVGSLNNDGRQYIIRPFLSETFFPGRSAEILYDDGKGGGAKVIGCMGILHPKVLQNFELSYPCSIVEMSIMDFV